MFLIHLAGLVALAWTPMPAQAQEVPLVMELLVNPQFQAETGGWGLRHAEYSKLPGHGTSGAALLRAERGADEWSHAGAIRDDPPTACKLRFTCWLRSEIDTSAVTINAFAYDSDKHSLGQWTQPAKLEKGAWQQVETSYVLDADTKELTLWIISSSTSDVLVSDAHLVAGEAAAPALRQLRGAGVVRASAATSVHARKAGEEGWVTFPVPFAYRGQIPLTFDLQVDPPEALKEFRWKRREDGTNVLCEARVAPPKGGAALRWESLVYVPEGAPIELPRAEHAVVPEEIRKWVRSTACVQSEDPGIVAKARELAESTDDVQGYVEKVLVFTSHNQGTPGAKFDTLDARQALACGGSCTSRANLAAALLRAHGIPARTVAHLPTWADRLYEHWLVEYWHPGAGWVWIEPTLGQLQPRPFTLAVINVANPEDEDRSFDASIRHSNVMLGAPEWSVHKHSPELFAGSSRHGDLAQGGNWAHAALGLGADAARTRRFADVADKAYTKLFAACRDGYGDRERTTLVEAALKAGNLDALERALEK